MIKQIRLRKHTIESPCTIEELSKRCILQSCNYQIYINMSHEAWMPAFTRQKETICTVLCGYLYN
jgi:hypothetical protein